MIIAENYVEIDEYNFVENLIKEKIRSIWSVSLSNLLDCKRFPSVSNGSSSTIYYEVMYSEGIACLDFSLSNIVATLN